MASLMALEIQVTSRPQYPQSFGAIANSSLPVTPHGMRSCGRGNGPKRVFKILATTYQLISATALRSALFRALCAWRTRVGRTLGGPGYKVKNSTRNRFLVVKVFYCFYWTNWHKNVLNIYKITTSRTNSQTNVHLKVYYFLLLEFQTILVERLKKRFHE